MSMYDLVVGDGNQRNRGAVLLAVLGNPDVGRYRDSWVERSSETGDPVIAIYTRNGGGNRQHECEDYGDVMPEWVNCTACATDVLVQHPLYIRDADDSFDQTYATFYFRAPEEHREELRAFAGEPVDMDKVHLDAIARLKAMGPR